MTPIFADGSLRQPAVFDPGRLDGDYALYDDGWACRLSLRRSEIGELEAAFHSYERTTGDFEAAVSADQEVSHRVNVVVSEFNELERQTYETYAFTRGVPGLAGVTEWKGERFGVYARRHPPYSVGRPRPGPVTPADFRGSFNLYCDGEHATVDLEGLDGSTVYGLLREPSGVELPVTVSIDGTAKHHAVIRIDGVSPDDPPALSVWMFSRQRTALAGWLDWGGSRLGCYLTKFVWF